MCFTQRERDVRRRRDGIGGARPIRASAVQRLPSLVKLGSPRTKGLRSRASSIGEWRPIVAAPATRVRRPGNRARVVKRNSFQIGRDYRRPMRRGAALIIGWSRVGWWWYWAGGGSASGCMRNCPGR
jgi:hypothetical protein